MSDSEPDLELLALLRDSLGRNAPKPHGLSSNTGVLKDAEYIANNSIDVSISMSGTKDAAAQLYKTFTEREYSAKSWNSHPLHPHLNEEGWDEEAMLAFVFTMDLLNFSFWSELPSEERWQVPYKGRSWAGYAALVAAIRRAGEQSRGICDPGIWLAEGLEGLCKEVFAGEGEEAMPMLEERVRVLREAGGILRERFSGSEDERVVGDGDTKDEAVNVEADLDALDECHGSAAGLPDEAQPSTELPAGPLEPATDHHIDDDADLPQRHSVEETASPSASASAKVDATNGADHYVVQRLAPSSRPAQSIVRLVEEADHSAGQLVNLLAEHFPCFRDSTRFEGRRVRFLKRAQIFVADLWAALNGKGLGRFDDIAHLTMFADYRVPQMLHNLGVLQYSPPLSARIRSHAEIAPSHSWEIELRGCSIWAVELMRRQIVKRHPEAEARVHAVLLDFLLYDLAKEIEASGSESIAHHRTRSIWY